MGSARNLLKSLMRRNPAIFNPLWKLAFPIFRPQEIYYGSEYVDRQQAFDTIYEQNRWGSGGLEESAIRPELVVEVRYDKVQGNRFRHGTRLLRFRPDKDAGECTWEQVRPKRRREDPTVEKLLGAA